ncbi:MAG: type IV pilin protein [Rubrivivax sp.]
MGCCRLKQGPQRGQTLAEVMVALGATLLLAGVALPTWQGHSLRAARIDAVDALTRVQMAQEQYRALHGLYSADLLALRGTGPVSAQGRYAITVETAGPDGFRAVARARGAQSGDNDCAELTVSVVAGFPTTGPANACWLQ